MERLFHGVGVGVGVGMGMGDVTCQLDGVRGAEVRGKTLFLSVSVNIARWD